MKVEIEYDEAKSELNRLERGFGFEAAHDFDWSTAVYVPDQRIDYGETRILALGFIGDRLHAIVFTFRGIRRRIISLRKANDREMKVYHGKQTP